MSEMATDQCCEAFARVCALGLALGIKNIGKLPGCWIHQVDKHWWIAMNGHRVQKAAQSKDGASSKVAYLVDPFDCYVEYNGWPAGTFNPKGGIIAAGECANEEEFIKAVIAATERARADCGPAEDSQ